MKPIIQAFALGMFVTTIILGFTYFQEDHSQPEKAKTITISEASNVLEKNGYKIFSQEEWRAFEEENQQATHPESNEPDTQNSADNQKNEVNNENDSVKENTNQPETTSYQLTIESGMESRTICNLLEEANIIDDADALNDFIIENGYDRTIQVGEFNLNSSMSYEDIAKTISGK